MQEAGNYNFEQQYTSSNQLSGWGYDQAGNLLTDGLGNSYQYDAESKIKSGPGATYSYTAEGQRVEKAVGSTTVDTVYFGGRPIARLSGGAWTDLIYAGGGLLAEVPGTQTGSPVYRVTDHLGSVVETLSSSGAVLGTQDLGPFGETFAGSVSDAFVFTGKERDAESGNDYFGARFYSSNIGRFMSPDWASQAEAVPYSDFSNPQSLNLYAYVSNNPTSRTDADGHLMAQGNSNGWWDPTSFYQFVRDSMNGGRRQTGGAALLASPFAQEQNYSTTTTVTLNSRAADISGGQLLHDAGVNHQWISTPDGASVGMGTAKGVPQSDVPGVKTEVVDHTGQVPDSTEIFTGVNKAALSTYTQVGTPTGRWVPGVNDCNTWARNAIYQSTPHDISIVVYGVPTVIAHNAVVYADGSIH